MVTGKVTTINSVISYAMHNCSAINKDYLMNFYQKSFMKTNLMVSSIFLSLKQKCKSITIGWKTSNYSSNNVLGSNNWPSILHDRDFKITAVQAAENTIVTIKNLIHWNVG